MSDEHFTVDGTLIEAWASQKNFQRKDGDADGDGTGRAGQSALQGAGNRSLCGGRSDRIVRDHSGLFTSGRRASRRSWTCPSGRV